MTWWQNEERRRKSETTYYNHSGQWKKRERLVSQCREHGIPACMGHRTGGKCVKPTTLGKMRRELEKRKINPCC